MSLTLAALIVVLAGTGTYLMLERTITRIILGLALLGNAVNLLIVAAGSRPGAPPIIGIGGVPADPVPQALVLTAIVIGFATQAFLLALAWRNWTLDGNDEAEDDISDRRLARRDDELGPPDGADDPYAGDDADLADDHPPGTPAPTTPPGAPASDPL